MDLNLFAHVFEIVAIVFLLMRDTQFTDVTKAQIGLNDAFQKYMDQVNKVLESQCEANDTQRGINQVIVARFEAQEKPIGESS
ncbi:MAG: hypothetical protein E2O79_09960 [Caldithrix sp.]|nr:MAG: hypothetical protein E2O79_09960 [Caldithrix sp.]